MNDVVSGVVSSVVIPAPLRVKRALTFADRLRGVGLQVAWREFDALYLPHCRAVHTFALAQAIDVVFLSADAVIVEVRARIAPWRIVTARASGACDTCEFPAGTCDRYRVTEGMSLEAVLQRLARGA